jgi:RHS repeat-associated protein
MVLAETTTGEDTIYYLHGLDLVAQSDGTNTEYFLYDALGSVRQLADDEATPLLTQTYDPYGTVYASVGVGASSYGYTNEYTDATGLLYLRARYYNPSMGRFLNVDPSRQERNLYEYATSNPVMFTDPSGLYPLAPPYQPNGIVTQSQFDVEGYEGNGPYNKGYYNFCGPFSATAIYQNLVDGDNLGIDEIIEDYLFVYVFEGVPSTKGLSWGELRDFTNRIPGIKASLLEYSYDNEVTFYRRIRKNLENKIWPIVGVDYHQVGDHPNYQLIKSDGGNWHWVVLSGLSEDWETTKEPAWRWVRIYNPFVNGSEYYRAATFWEFQPSSREVLWVREEGNAHPIE